MSDGGFYVDNFDIKDQVTSRQRMIKVYHHFVVIKRRYHARHFLIVGIRKRQQQTLLQGEVSGKIGAGKLLHVVGVMPAEALLRRQVKTVFVAGAQAKQYALKTVEKILVPHCKRRRAVIKRGIHHGTILQLNRKVQGYLSARTDDQLIGSGHGSVTVCLVGFFCKNSISNINRPAPVHMAESAILNVGNSEA